MQKEIFEKLEKANVKLSKVESDLGTPKNYLSRFKDPKNKLPLKWEIKLLDYIKEKLGDLSDKVTTADKIPDLEGYHHHTSVENKNYLSDALKEKGVFDSKWIKEIEDYCGKEGITPEDLILSHKAGRKSKKGTNALETEKTANLPDRDAKGMHSTWFGDYRKKKLFGTK